MQANHYSGGGLVDDCEDLHCIWAHITCVCGPMQFYQPPYHMIRMVDFRAIAIRRHA